MIKIEDEGFFYSVDYDDPYYRVILPNMPHLMKGEDTGYEFKGMNINQILKNEYPHLYESIHEENYFISDEEHCYYFFEIPDNNDKDIIGFASFEIHNEETIILNQIYVLPEHRGKQNFYQVMNYFMDLLNEATIMIKNPNKRIMNELDNVDLITKINERFWLSKIHLMYDLVPYEDTFKYTRKTYNMSGNRFETSIRTTLYDTQLGALLNLALKNNKPYTGKEHSNVKRCSISLVKDEDETEYQYLRKRKNDPWIKKGNYFQKVKKLLKKKNII